MVPRANPPGSSTPAGIGASPSGKAADFDSAMRRFESSRPSQCFEMCRKIKDFNGFQRPSEGHSTQASTQSATQGRPQKKPLIPPYPALKLSLGER